MDQTALKRRPIDISSHLTIYRSRPFTCAVPGIGPATAQIILAEIGADMSRFPTPEHLLSWLKLRPRTIQSGTKNTAGSTGQRHP